ncbi:MAG: addiction module toxin RelE [Candidatus Woesearchaeota archaeon]
MRYSRDSNLFKKKIERLTGQELVNLLNKIDEILESSNLDHYKNLKHDLKKYKRVHVNDSYIILFFGKDEVVYFVDYAHHDEIYKHSKKSLKKYKELRF